MAHTLYPLLNSSISTCTFATDGSGDITVGASHGLSAGAVVRFSTTGALPFEITVNGVYYVLSAGLTTTKLRIALTAGGTLITFATAGTGTHTIWKSTINGDFDPRTTTTFPPTGFQIPPTALYSDKTSLLNTQVAGCDFNGTTITCAVAHGLAADDLVRFWLDQPFSPPLSPNARYYVLSSGLTTRNFQISLTQGGTPIDFGPPSPDVFLRNYGGRWFPDNDVALFYVKPVLYKKSTAYAVMIDDDPWGLYSVIKVVWAFSQHLICTCADSLNVADSVVGRIQPTRVSATESLSISESIIMHAPQRLTVAESLTTADVATRIGQFVRLHEITSASNQLAVASGAVVTLPKMRTVAEILTVIDEAAQTIGPGSNVTESLALSDSAQRLLALVRSQTEALSLSEFVTGSRTNLRLVDEALSLSDSVARLVAYGRGAVEALSITVSVIGPGMIGVDATDSLSLAESLSRVWGAGRLASELLSIADLAFFLASYHFSATETLLIADSADAARLRPASATETLLIASVATFGGNYGRQSGETLVLSLAANRRLALRRVVTQLLQILESPTAASGFVITAQEALRIEEWAHWITGPHDPWEYWLDLRTGNLPLESELDQPEAESIASVPEAESELDAPEAESELVGSVADSGLRYIDP